MKQARARFNLVGAVIFTLLAAITAVMAFDTFDSFQKTDRGTPAICTVVSVLNLLAAVYLYSSSKRRGSKSDQRA